MRCACPRIGLIIADYEFKVGLNWIYFKLNWSIWQKWHYLEFESFLSIFYI